MLSGSAYIIQQKCFLPLISSFPVVTDIEVPKSKSKIYCDDKSKDEGFPYARPIICHMSGDVRASFC
jgi:hypothetical protein